MSEFQIKNPTAEITWPQAKRLMSLFRNKRFDANEPLTVQGKTVNWDDQSPMTYGDIASYDVIEGNKRRYNVLFMLNVEQASAAIGWLLTCPDKDRPAPSRQSAPSRPVAPAKPVESVPVESLDDKIASAVAAAMAQLVPVPAPGHTMARPAPTTVELVAGQAYNVNGKPYLLTIGTNGRPYLKAV